MINILLLEDHPIFRLGVRHLLRQRWPEANIGEAGTLAEAHALITQAPWQVAVVDLNLPDAKGLEVVFQLQRRAPELRLLVLSLNEEADYAQQALKIGASGYLAKDQASSDLILAVESILSSGHYISSALAGRLLRQSRGETTQKPHEALSPQEYRVMLQLAAGRRNGDIAEGMFLSPKTISTYRTRIFEKLNMDNIADLTAYCVRHGLRA